MNSSEKLVLVVEDFEDNRFMMRRLLELAGYRVIEATDGEQALAVALEERPALILMDLSLPRMDGLTATRNIRLHPELQEVPIIAVSAHDSRDFHLEATAAGCDHYVAKPIDFDELEILLHRILGEPERAGQ